MGCKSLGIQCSDFWGAVGSSEVAYDGVLSIWMRSWVFEDVGVGGHT